MSRLPLAALSAVMILTAALAGCAKDGATTTPTAASLTAPKAAPAGAAVLPQPAELTAVLDKLADVAVPGTDKLPLVEGSTADDAVQFDKFSRALRDGGFTPPTFTATDLAWSDKVAGNVVATIAVSSPNPGAGGFSFPMDFKFYRGSWQLSEDTADLLLNVGSAEG